MESEFLTDNKENGRSIISLGIPESGKSYLALKYCLWSLKHNIYDEIHLIAPALDHEQNKSYDFLKKFKNQVFFYKKYHEVVAKKIDKLRHAKKILFMIDDASAELLNNVDTTFIKLWTTTRHSLNGGLTFWVIAHTAKKVIPPMIRQNVKYIFIYRIESSELLEDTIYKEFLSLQYRKTGKRYDDFVNDYMAIMDGNNYGVMLVARKLGIDFYVNDWQLFNEKETSKKFIEKIPVETQQPTTSIFSKVLFNKK